MALWMLGSIAGSWVCDAFAADDPGAEPPLAIPAATREPPPPPVVPPPPPPPAAVMVPAGPEEPLRSGVSFGLSAGLTTGVGITFGVPLGRSVALQVTGLPFAIPDQGAGGSIGLRAQQFVGRNPKTRLYFVEGGQGTGFGPDWLWGFGAGAGIEMRKQWDTGLTKWFDVTVTALGTGDELLVVLPLPEFGIGWVF